MSAFRGSTEAVNYIVEDYLNTSYPTVATVFKKSAKSSRDAARKEFGTRTLSQLLATKDSDSDSDAPPRKVQVVEKKASPALKPAAKKAVVADSDSDDEPVKKPVAVAKAASPALKPAAKKAVVADSDSDDEPVKKPVAVAKAASPALKPAAKKAVVADSDSDDEPVKKPVAVAKKASPALKPAAKKAVVADSDSDDEPVKKPVAVAKKASPALKPVAKKAAVAESDSDDEPVKKPVAAAKAAQPMDDSDSDDEPLKRPAPVAKKPDNEEESRPYGKRSADESSAAPRNSRGPRTENAPIQRFQRIDPTKVTFINDALRDNRPGAEASNFRQNQEMMRVRGKEFNKHKQKNKGKLYAAGVIEDVRSFKFTYDDD